MINLRDKTILDTKVGNITSSNSQDKVMLLGQYFDKDSPYIENLEIDIKPKEGQEIKLPISYSGYNLELFLGDFNGDDKDEIMIRGDSGGSGRYAIATVYNYSDGKFVEIFNPSMFSEKYEITAKYLDGYKVLVQVPSLNKKYIFDISNRPKQNLNDVYDENGKVKEYQEPSVSNINSAFPIKIPSSKNLYLFIRQRIVGNSNADTIGYIESFVSLLDNKIKVEDMGFYEFGNEEKLNRKENITMEQKFPLGTIFIPLKDLGFKEEELKVDLDFDGKDEIIVPYTLDGVPYLAILKEKNNDYVIQDSFKGEGYTIKELILRKKDKEYTMFVGFGIGGKVNKLEILTYKNRKISIKFKDDGYYYSEMYLKDLDGDGNEELILWLQDTGKAYHIDVYSIKKHEIKKTNKYDKIYYKEIVEYYKNLLKTYVDSSTYLYYLALAYEKVRNFTEALNVINKALKTKYPYPSVKELQNLKKNISKHLKKE